MPTQNLTDTTIRNLKPKPQQYEVWDHKLPAFGVRVSPLGTVSYVVLYRVDGRLRRYTFGRYASLKLADARKRVRDILSDVSKGKDPAAEKALRRSSPTAFDQYIGEFIERFAKPRNKSWRETERILKREFGSRWRGRELSSIQRSDVIRVVDGIVDQGTPIAANHAFAAIRKLMNWAVERGDIEVSPCLGLRAPSPVKSRDRVLSQKEISQIWAAAKQMGYPFGPLVQLLFLTAQRRSEVASLCWQDIDFKKDQWSMTDNKSSRPHLVPLSPLAISVLNSIPRTTSKHVFPAKGKNRPVSGFSKWKAELDRISGVKNWTLHDIRRTAATGMAERDVEPHVIERVLNHQTGILGGVTGTYNRFSYLDEMRRALNAWSIHLLKIV